MHSIQKSQSNNAKKVQKKYKKVKSFFQQVKKLSKKQTYMNQVTAFEFSPVVFAIDVEIT